MKQLGLLSESWAVVIIVAIVVAAFILSLVQKKTRLRELRGMRNSRKKMTFGVIEVAKIIRSHINTHKTNNNIRIDYIETCKEVVIKVRSNKDGYSLLESHIDKDRIDVVYKSEQDYETESFALSK